VTESARPCSHLHPSLPHLQQGVAHPAHKCTGAERHAACCWLQQGAPAMDASCMMRSMRQNGPFPLVFAPPPYAPICDGNGSPLPQQLPCDWAHPLHICTGTQLAPAHGRIGAKSAHTDSICTRARLTPSHIRTETGLIPGASSRTTHTFSPGLDQLAPRTFALEPGTPPPTAKAVLCRSHRRWLARGACRCARRTEDCHRCCPVAYSRLA
jgi:hypothetical protein